jgi:hypothetical protein
MNEKIKISKKQIEFCRNFRKIRHHRRFRIAILDNDLNLTSIDKSYRLNDIKFFIDNLSNKDSVIISIDIPTNNMFLIGKWRQESKHYQSFTVGTNYDSKQVWSTRQSSRGSDVAQTIRDEGFDVFRYNSSYTKVHYV